MARGRRAAIMAGMAKPPGKYVPEPEPEMSERLDAELRRRGMSEAEIKAALRKKKRRKVIEFNAVRYPAHGRLPSAAQIPDELCTVEHAAGQLKLHPKTVLRFIRDGRLRATRVGKSYRILRADLDAFSGVPPRAEAPGADAWVTSIVDVSSVGPELAQKWARTVPGALGAGPHGTPPMRAEVIYEPERSHLKIVVTGPPAETVNLLALIRVWLEQLRA